MPRYQGRRGGNPPTGPRESNAGQKHNRRYNNIGDAMIVDSYQNGSSNGAQRTCHNCGKAGHIAKDCRKQVHQNGQNNNQQTPPQCAYCQKVGHTQAQCFKDPSNKQNKSSDGNTSASTKSNSKHGIQSHDEKPNNGLAMSGFTFANCIPTYTGPAPYCPSCNLTTHDHRYCPNQQCYQRLQYSVLVCWKCGFRGHTGDDCQHPSPQTQSQRCGVCHSVGHNAEVCKNEAQRKLRAAVAGVSQEGGSRFVWHDSHGLQFARHPTQMVKQSIEDEVRRLYEEGVMLTPEMEAEARKYLLDMQKIDFPAQHHQQHHHQPQQQHIVAAFHTSSPPPMYTSSLQKSPPPPPYSPPPSYTTSISRPTFLSRISPNLASLASPPQQPNHPHPHQPCISDQEDPTRLPALRAKVARSSTLYPKRLYNALLGAHMSEIKMLGLICPTTCWELSKRLAQGFQFWRDPRAMEALVLEQRAVCYTCQQEGVLLDGNMCGVRGRDPLVVVDAEEWGMFVMFDCRCCRDGYGYVPS